MLHACALAQLSMAMSYVSWRGSLICSHISFLGVQLLSGAEQRTCQLISETAKDTESTDSLRYICMLTLPVLNGCKSVRVTHSYTHIRDVAPHCALQRSIDASTAYAMWHRAFAIVFGRQLQKHISSIDSSECRHTHTPYAYKTLFTHT